MRKWIRSRGEVGALDPNDPKRADLIKEIFRLTELARALSEASIETKLH